MSASTVHTATYPISKGVLTVTIKVSMFELTPAEREILFEAVDKLKQLAVKATEPVAETCEVKP